MYPLYRLLLLLAAAAVSACASMPLQHARQAYQAGDYEQAAMLLSSDEIRHRDRLLALMETGSVWHEAGDYRRSSDALLRASSLLRSTQYISLSEQSASLTINEWSKTYKGESAEQLWIHSYQMMNFLLLGKYESAAVEARRAIALFERYAEELQTDFFSRALLAMAFDSVGLYNDAYIEYRKLSELLPSNTLLGQLRDDRAGKSGIPVAAGKHKTPVPASDGELILFVATGQIPRKITADLVLYPGERISFPVYARGLDPEPALQLVFDSDTPGEVKTSALAGQIISTDLGQVAGKALAARGGRIAARHIARSSIKNALVDAAEADSASAAAFLDVLFFLLEEADTRSWSTLPAHLSLLRIPLPSGRHSLTISNLRGSGPVLSYKLEDIAIKPGSRVYRKVRL